ncbi:MULTISPECIES: ureidoglycolate lyase [unclassified Oceanispirochaeta]|uniref:ureidoglycolate lyase n=1 Tax=unclassified Oceanispirochaeta TaxID=2635722 RepID=UPI000E08F899|nr:MULTISPECIES: ureidoglycolate lyase [unclassified Oceanispirochaeta]MBF9015816.1 ureidoglycolate lyase [Oceanispirochaeta sp. M2]NPD72279.1 hypothetical protein [Oceanispirochaeta sp. M1]RDG32372.1 hypothetical protein DV872_09220 [Oceanispirochaeta sp. M1]
MKLQIEKMTAENSKEFGTLLSIKEKDAAYKGDDFSFFKNLAEIEFNENIGFSLVETHMDTTVEISWLERHLSSSELIIPSDKNIVLVLGSGEKTADLSTLRALEVEVGTAFSVSRNVWHFAPISCSDTTNVFILLNQSTPDCDLEKIDCESIGLTV